MVACLCLFVNYLAHFAYVGAAGGDADFGDGCATAGAGLAVSAKDICKAQVTPLFAFGIHIVFVGTTAFFYG